MFEQEYQQISIDAEGRKVILQFPAEQSMLLLDEGGCMRFKDIEMLKKEIKEIFICELQEKIKQNCGL